MLDNRMPAKAVKELLSYNPETGELRWCYRESARASWNTRYAGKVAGTKKPGEIQVSVSWEGRKRLYRAHHLAWAIQTGEWPPGEVDHRDGDPHNNAWTNLRRATRAQNCANRRVVTGELALLGVYFVRNKGRFGAQIKKDGEHTWLGLFENPESAARAYDAAAKKLHGEFAVTNTSLGLLPEVTRA